MAQFWRPKSSSAPPHTLLIDTDNSEIPIVNRNKHLSLHQQRQVLPIYQYRNQILYAVEKYRTLVLVGETGCGKSTQIPQFLHENGWTDKNHSIICTQPRRVAAISVASRVAEELGCILGTTVGYGVRFDFKCTTNTAIKFYTDGVLIREFMSDPLLRKYSLIIVDEAHLRSLNTDILLGLLKKVFMIYTYIRR